MKIRLHALAASAWLWAVAALAATPQVVDLPTRGVTERILVEQPEQAPKAVLVLMTGGGGRLHVFDDGRVRNGGNFLVRTRALFVQHGFAVVLPDTPSDHNSPPFLGDSFRESAGHAADLAAVIAWSRQKFSRPVWIVGTSRGTQSAANAAIRLAGTDAPDGVVLTSSILAMTRVNHSTPVQDMPLETVRLPVLVVHHAQDQCRACPPSQLPRLMDKLKATTAQLMTFEGGVVSGPACEPFAHHGYNGIESEVVNGIAAWVESHLAARR
jgi:pimeloyl-ACP methyl ester carboxylesterase